MFYLMEKLKRVLYWASNRNRKARPTIRLMIPGEVAEEEEMVVLAVAAVEAAVDEEVAVAEAEVVAEDPSRVVADGAMETMAKNAREVFVVDEEAEAEDVATEEELKVIYSGPTSFQTYLLSLWPGRDGDNEGGEDGEFNGEKAKEFYIPPEPSNDESEIFGQGISSGINFSKYDKIPVNVSL